ncbi:phage integrase SAM-like domain-containing protein [Aeromonas veronii]|nr:phage integrase SAM-like domain-containing protein [Aeromonas veronii]
MLDTISNRNLFCFITYDFCHRLAKFRKNSRKRDYNSPVGAAKRHKLIRKCISQAIKER